MKIISLLAACACACAFAAETFTTGYRVLHASPQEVVSALNMPAVKQAPRVAVETQKGRVASRMQKYFRVRRKSIDGHTITMEIAPEVPLLGTRFADVATFTLKFTETSRTTDTFTYDVKISTKPDGSNAMDTTMTVSPNISGSLLTLRLNNPSLFSRAFAEAAMRLGFLERTAEDAATKER